MKHTYSTLLLRWLPRPLVALGLLLATASTTHAQLPTSLSYGVAPQQVVLAADPTLPTGHKPKAAPTWVAARTTATQRLGTSWTTMAAMSQARVEPGTVAHPNGRIYVWGGYGPGGLGTEVASAEAYTPSNDTWAAIASLPAALCGPATAVGTDGALYSFGGRQFSNYLNNCYKYNVATNSWAAIAPLPVARWEARALTAPDGRIFVFGGWNAFINSPVGMEVQIYTPATNTWSMGAAMPVGLFGSAAGVDAAGLMHLYGGISNGQTPSTAHLIYNVPTNSWTTALATPTPARAYTTGLAGADGNLYLCGGDNDIPVNTGTYYSQVDSYNPTTATWSSEPALPVALTEAASAATGGYLYVVGGYNGTAQRTLYRIAVVAAPTLTTISPTSAAVGSSVTLTGSNLTGATAVTFAGTSNNTVTTGLTVSGTGSSQTITVAVPSGAISGPVTVTTPNGTSNSVAFTVISIPTVTTAATDINIGSATFGGNGTADGGAPVTERGVVYSSTNSTPTIGGSGVTQNQNGMGTGNFSKLITGFTLATRYTVRAYAINSAGVSYGNAITIGPLVSRLLSIERINSSPTNASIVTYVVTFSIPVQGLTLRNFALSTTGTITSASIQDLRSLTANATYSDTYGVVVNTGTGDGTLTLYLANYTGTLPGIEIPVPTPGNPTYIIDKTPPTTTISTTATNPTSSTPIPFTVTFSESVTGFTASDIAVTNGTITSALSIAGNAYSFTVTPAASGLVTVNVPANGANDAAFNGNIAASPLSLTYIVPVTATSWTGAVSTDWYTSGNWTAGVPTTTVDATINSVSTGRYPLVASGTASTRNLTINSGARLNMTNGTLDVRGNWTNNSSFAATGGTVALGTSTLCTIVGSGTTQFWNLRAEASGILLATSAGATVQQVLTLNGEFLTNNNSFTLLSNAAGTALVVNTSSNVVRGAVTVQRYIDPSLNPGLGYRHYSSPVANSTVADLATTGFTPVLNSAYNTSPSPNDVVPFPTVFGYDQALVNRTNATPNFDKGFFSPASFSTPLVPGRGYNANIGATELVDFVGTLNNGDLSVPLARNAAGTVNAADAGWQFLGNPYPAPLDYSQVAPADRAGLEDAIYVYSSTSAYSGQYRAYVNGVGGGNPIIPVAQGFFARVATPSTSGTFTFRNSQRLTSPNATSFQRTAANQRPLIQLELEMAKGPADTFYAYAEAGATSAFDAAYDAPKLRNPTGLNLSSVTDTDNLAIDGRAAFTTATTLPLAVGVPAAGAYTLTAAALDNLPAGLTAFLRDAQTGQTTKLTAGTSYNFYVSAAEAQALILSRFTVVFSPQTALATAPVLAVEAISVYPNPAHSSFTVTMPGVTGASAVHAELVNTLGQVVHQQVAALPASGASFHMSTAELAAGVYVLRLQAGATTLTKRVVVQ